MVEKVAYSGIIGAFAQLAASRIYPNACYVAYPSFQAAYDAVLSGECDRAVLPVENSFAGEVGQVMDIIFSGPMYVNGMYDMEVVQALLGTKDAQTSDVKRVISHPQALEQCGEFLSARGIETIPASNTAQAAKQTAQLDDKQTAAIAYKENAVLYGLKVLEENICDQQGNTTRFAVLSNEKETTEKDNFLLMFTVGDVAGALAKAINVIGDCGFNMTAIRSRPMHTLPWKYYFYAQIEGDSGSEKCEEMLARLSKRCESLKIAGSFRMEKI